MPEPSVDIYFDLLQSIVSQQLSVKVAAIIWQRFLDLFPDQYPTDRILQEETDEVLRSVGLSRQKANYLRNVATFSIENGMGFELLCAKTDEEIIAYLTQIKGVGKWTVQMVLMFPMDRPNVCLLYTSDAADDSLRVDLGGRRIIKKIATSCLRCGR